MLKNETFVPKDYFKDKIGVLLTKKDLKTLKDICDTCGFTYVGISDFYLEQMKIMYYDFNTCKLYLNSLPKELKDIKNLYGIEALADKLKTFLTTNQTIINNQKTETTMKTFNQTPGQKMSKKSMFNSIIEKYKSQYFPTKVDDLRIATDGSICVPMGDEYVAIDAQNNLKAYPAELCMSVPVFTVKKPFSEIKAGDIVKHNSQYAKVISTEPKNNSIKTLTYKGVTSTKKEITDVILGQSFVEVVVNMFSGFGANTGGINPMFLMMAQEGGDFSMKDMLMLQMMQDQGQSFNPMMLMLLGEKDGDSNSMMDMMVMSQLCGGQGFNFGNLFGQQSTPATPVQE